MLISSIELINYNPELLTEEFNKTNKLILKDMVLQRANTKNKNGRIYPREVLEAEVTRYTNEYVSERRSFGELDHTDGQSVEVKTSSHIISRIYWDGDTVKGDVEILHTLPAGNIVKNLLLIHKCPIGISSRANGSTHYDSERDADIVENDLAIICWDLVSDPSTHGASYKINENSENNSNNLDYNKINSTIHDIICGLNN